MRAAPKEQNEVLSQIRQADATQEYNKIMKLVQRGASAKMMSLARQIFL